MPRHCFLHHHFSVFFLLNIQGMKNQHFQMNFFRENDLPKQLKLLLRCIDKFKNVSPRKNNEIGSELKLPLSYRASFYARNTMYSLRPSFIWSNSYMGIWKRYKQLSPRSKFYLPWLLYTGVRFSPLIYHFNKPKQLLI